MPGTGLSWREYHKPVAHAAQCDLCAPGHVHFPAWLVLVILLAIVIPDRGDRFQRPLDVRAQQKISGSLSERVRHSQGQLRCIQVRAIG